MFRLEFLISLVMIMNIIAKHIASYRFHLQLLYLYGLITEAEYSSNLLFKHLILQKSMEFTRCCFENSKQKYKYNILETKKCKFTKVKKNFRSS